jgi:hypothetical protein
MKFNTSNRRTGRATNYEGAPAWYLSPEWELYSMAVTSTLENGYYETAEKRVKTLRRLVAENDPKFVAQLAVYAREQMNLRSIPLVLAVELSGVHFGDSLVCRLTSRIIRRADEIAELLAYYQVSNERKKVKKLNCLSKQLQYGLQEAFNRFDEYQFAKYNRSTEVKLRDALFLVHPKAKDENQQELFNRIAENRLKTPYTWETELSMLGQKKYGSETSKKLAFAQKWEELIDSNRLGYMALLRNLKNILNTGVSGKRISHVCETLASEDRVLESKQLPFRFLAAYRELSEFGFGYPTQMMDALEKAVEISARNIAGFDKSKKTLIACDVSGSMRAPVSQNSRICRYDIGLMLGVLLKSKCPDAVFGIFGDRWKTVNVPDGGILKGVSAMSRLVNSAGYSTNAHLVLQDLIDRRQVMDKIMIFTDCQMWNSLGRSSSIQYAWRKYRDMAPKAKLYLFDLSGYGTAPLDIAEKDVYLIAGWSEKIFDILTALDSGKNALRQIKEIEL